MIAPNESARGDAAEDNAAGETGEGLPHDVAVASALLWWVAPLVRRRHTGV